MTTPPQDRAEQRGFLFGVMWAAWWLHSGHGEDTYAADLLRESMSASTARRIARQQDYLFKRGFWQQSAFRRDRR
jgi:hypothetical protein